MPDLDICFAADQNFGRYLHFAIASILFSAAPDDRLRFHILSHGIERTDRERILALAAGERPGTQVEFTDFAYQDFAALAMEGSSLTPAAFGRFLVPRLFPELDRVLYLDGDLVVTASLAPLWNTPLDGCAIGAVEDIMSIKKRAHPAAIGLRSGRYFNSGVLLIDCLKWRTEDTFEALLALGQNRIFPFMDQDLLNLHFEGRVKFLDPVWNVHTGQQRSAASKIVHYTGKKPWDFLLVKDLVYFWDVALRLPDSKNLLPGMAAQVRKTTWISRRLQRCVFQILAALGLNRTLNRIKVDSYRQLEKLLPALREYFQV